MISVIEFIKHGLTVLSWVLIWIGASVLVFRLICAPLFALLSIPTYGIIIGLEFLFINKVNGVFKKVLNVSKPKTFWKLFSMNAVASITTLCGIYIALPFVFETIAAFEQKRCPIYSVFPEYPLSILLAFICSLGIVYAISFSLSDDEKHPLNKVEDLIVIPEWLKRLWR